MQQEEVIGKYGVRDRMKIYAEECQKKKDIERRERLQVGSLQDSMTDISKFESPSKSKQSKQVDLLSIRKIESPGIFNFEPEPDDYPPNGKAQANNNSFRSGKKPGASLDDDSDDSEGPPMCMSMRPGLVRGRSFEDRPRASSPPRINNMRPGMMRGTSFGPGDDDGQPEKPQQVKDLEEKSAKRDLASLLAEDNRQQFDLGNEAVYLKPFSSMRNGYMNAVIKLRPEEKPFHVQTKEQRKEEAEKVKKYTKLQDAWYTYDDTAQDKPDSDNLTPEEEKVEDEVRKVENDVANEWIDYAEEVVKAVQDEEEDDDDSEGDDEWDFWISEAKRLKEEAARKTAEERAAAKKKKKREKDRQQEAFDNEGEDVQAIAKRLKEEARLKAEDEANKKSKGGNDSDDEVNSPKKSSAAGKKGKGRFDDSDSDDEDEASSPKKGKVASKKGFGGSDSDDSDDGDASPSKKAKAKGKKGKGRFDSDSESDESDGERKSYKKKKEKVEDRLVEKVVDPSTPTPTKKKKALVEDKLPSPKTPRNQDGTLWKNPLKRWTNKPKKKVKEVNAQIILKVPEKTDCWRKTRHNFIMDNAPYHWQKVTGDFEAIVKVSGGFGTMYDKAGIMVREDAENWILTGMEYFNKRVNHSTCVTRDFTDWSLSPLPEGSEAHGIWFCIKRMGNSYETFYSVDGKLWVQTRQGLFTDKSVLKVGICCACPMGVEFKVTFDSYRCKMI